MLADIYKAYYSFHTIFRTFNLYLSTLFNFFMVINCLILILLKDYIPAELAVMTLSFITVVMNLLGGFGKTLSEMLSQMPSVERIIDYSKLE